MIVLKQWVLGLLTTSDLPHGKWGIWHIDEDVSFFQKYLTLHLSEKKEIESLHGRKLREWYGSRHLLHQLINDPFREACLKDKNGKPYIPHSHLEISISHSGDYAAVIISDSDVGIDIQTIVPKISRIAQKFIEPEAWSFIPENDNLLYLHAIWGAKESLYKAYGRRGLDFKKDIKILPFTFNPQGFYFEGILQKGEYYKKFNLFCRQIDQLILVYATEII